jgi:hypothetical protein
MSLTDDDKNWFLQQMSLARTENHRDIEELETKLLRAFHDWASPVE